MKARPKQNAAGRKQHHCGVLNQPASAKAYTSSLTPSSKLQFSRNNASGDGAFDHSISPMFLKSSRGSTRACRSNLHENISGLQPVQKIPWRKYSDN